MLCAAYTGADNKPPKPHHWASWRVRTFAVSTHSWAGNFSILGLRGGTF